MLYDIHLILPEATEFDIMSPALQAQLDALDKRWPSFPGIGTRPYDGNKLIHARIRHPDLTKTVLEGMFAAHSLTWEVVGIRCAIETPTTYDSDGLEIQAAHYEVIEPIDKATVLPYLADISELDENDNVITRPVGMLDTIYLPMYSNTGPILVN